MPGGEGVDSVAQLEAESRLVAADNADIRLRSAGFAGDTDASLGRVDCFGVRVGGRGGGAMLVFGKASNVEGWTLDRAGRGVRSDRMEMALSVEE